METILEKITKERGISRLSGTESNKLTKECLQAALVYLMGEKPFEKITITEIVRISGVSRQSFYRSYTSKEDVLSDMQKLIADEIEGVLRRLHKQENGFRFYREILQYIKDHEETIRLLDKAFMNQKKGYILVPAIHEMFEITDKEEHYQLMAYEGGINSILLDWFQNGMKEDIDFMARICDDLYGALQEKLAVKTK